MREAPDVLVVGAGVFGLWCARACLREGLAVAVADRGWPGAGASGGPVGALVPHDPVGWSPLKAFQLAGLLSIGAEAAALEAETGLATGYDRCGRLSPLGSARAAARLSDQAAAALRHWRGAGTIAAAGPEAAGLVAPEAAPHGLLADTLSARIDPPRYLAALRAAVAPRVRWLPGWRLVGLAPGAARFDRGRVAAGRIVLAMGWEGFGPAGIAGGGVKGQAALLDATLPPGVPLVAAPGLFVVPHGPGRVAVGSTSEAEWSVPGPDAALDAVIARAAAVVPALAGAPVLRRWAGIRPRGPGPGPVIGPLPGRSGVLVASGGFRIGFALAHLAGAAVAAEICGTAPEVPPPPGSAPLSAGTPAPRPAGTAPPARPA